MNDLYDLCYHVESELTGVPEELVKFTLRGVLRDFCRRTFSWRQKTYTRISKEVRVYDAAGFADAEVLAVLFYQFLCILSVYLDFCFFIWYFFR